MTMLAEEPIGTETKPLERSAHSSENVSVEKQKLSESGAGKRKSKTNKQSKIVMSRQSRDSLISGGSLRKAAFLEGMCLLE